MQSIAALFRRQILYLPPQKVIVYFYELKT